MGYLFCLQLFGNFPELTICVPNFDSIVVKEDFIFFQWDLNAFWFVQTCSVSTIGLNTPMHLKECVFRCS